MTIKEEHDAELRKQIVSILSDSDIVWTKYGSESIEQLTAKIVKRVTDVLKESN